MSCLDYVNGLSKEKVIYTTVKWKNTNY
jgi:hypothetical protein